MKFLRGPPFGGIWTVIIQFCGDLNHSWGSITGGINKPLPAKKKKKKKKRQEKKKKKRKRKEKT